MSLRTSQANLTDDLKVLEARWQRVRERWDDAKSAEIQAEVIEPMAAMVRGAIQALDQVSELTARARAECADDEPG